MKIKDHIAAQQFVACEETRLLAFLNRVQTADLARLRPRAESDPSNPANDDPDDFWDDLDAFYYPPRPAIEINEMAGVAIIPVIGMITKGLSIFEQRFFGCADIDTIAAMVDQVAANEKIETVLFYFNSPGGYITGVEELANKIAALTAMSGKSTYAYADDICASAAYALAMNCGEFWAAGSSLIGSIGVKVTYVDYSAMAANQGIKVQVFASGQYKGMGTPGTSLTPAQMEFIQAGIDREGAKFKAAVQALRPVSDESIQGQCFSGEEAAAAGLIDGIFPDYQSVLTLLS